MTVKYGPGVGPDPSKGKGRYGFGKVGKNGKDHNMSGKPKRGGGGGNKFYGGYAGYKGVQRKEASQLVGGDIRKLLDELQREIKSNHRDMKNEVGRINTQYGRTTGDLNHIFGETGEFIGNQNKAIDATYDAAQTQTAGAQAALQSQMAANGQANAADANGELARLGMSGIGTGQMQADQANAQNMAAVGGANNQANLALMQAGSSSIGNLLLGANSATQGSMLGSALNARNDSVNEAHTGFNDFKAGIKDQMRDVKGQRGDMVRDLLQQLAQTGWAQYMDQQNLNQNQQQLNMQNRSMNHGFAQDRQAASAQASYNATMAGGLGAFWNGGAGGGGGGKKKPKKPKHGGNVSRPVTGFTGMD